MDSRSNTFIKHPVELDLTDENESYLEKQNDVISKKRSNPFDEDMDEDEEDSLENVFQIYPFLADIIRQVSEEWISREGKKMVLEFLGREIKKDDKEKTQKPVLKRSQGKGGVVKHH